MTLYLFAIYVRIVQEHVQVLLGAHHNTNTFDIYYVVILL